MEPIIDYLRRRLKEVGSARWEAIAVAAKVNKHLPRKIVYEPKRDFGVSKIQPLYTYFLAVDRRERELPWDGKTERRKTVR